MEPNLPPQAGAPDFDTFFGFDQTLDDFFSLDTSDLPQQPPPPLSSADQEFSFEDIMAIVDPLPDQILPVESNAFTTGNVTAGGVKGSAMRMRMRKVSIKPGSGKSKPNRKAMSKEKLEELLRVDPKRAKRIMANRKSAAKSKERKMDYESQLEENIKELEMLLAAIDLELETDLAENEAMIAENIEIQNCINEMLKEIAIREANIERLKNEVEQLKIDIVKLDVLIAHYSQLALHRQGATPPAQHMVPQPQQPQNGFAMPLAPPQIPAPVPSSPSPSAHPQFNVQDGPAASNPNFSPLN